MSRMTHPLQSARLGWSHGKQTRVGRVCTGRTLTLVSSLPSLAACIHAVGPSSLLCWGQSMARSAAAGVCRAPTAHPTLPSSLGGAALGRQGQGPVHLETGTRWHPCLGPVRTPQHGPRTGAASGRPLLRPLVQGRHSLQCHHVRLGTAWRVTTRETQSFPWPESPAGLLRALHIRITDPRGLSVAAVEPAA